MTPAAGTRQNSWARSRRQSLRPVARDAATATAEPGARSPFSLLALRRLARTSRAPTAGGAAALPAAAAANSRSMTVGLTQRRRRASTAGGTREGEAASAQTRPTNQWESSPFGFRLAMPANRRSPSSNSLVRRKVRERRARGGAGRRRTCAEGPGEGRS